MIRKCYKVTGPNGEPCHGGSGRWIPGEWREENGTEPCQPGMMHFCKDARQLIDWLNVEIWEAEYDDAKLVIDHGDKLAVQRARVIRKMEIWNDRTTRLFACNCAEAVLPIYEKHYPNDMRPRECVETARKFAHGKATREEMAARTKVPTTKEEAHDQDQRDEDTQLMKPKSISKKRHERKKRTKQMWKTKDLEE